MYAAHCTVLFLAMILIFIVFIFLYFYFHLFIYLFIFFFFVTYGCLLDRFLLMDDKKGMHEGMFRYSELCIWTSLRKSYVHAMLHYTYAASGLLKKKKKKKKKKAIFFSIQFTIHWYIPSRQTA